MKTIDLILKTIAVVPLPGPRAALWLRLRGQKYPDQLPQLLKALHAETADVVRKEIITQLALDFSDDPAARTALAAIAAAEPQTLPRHVAERALFGDAPWRDYVVTTIRDGSLSAAQRLDPLTWMLDTRLRYPRVEATFRNVVPALLDGDGPRVLAELLARKQKESADVAGGLVVIQLSALDLPAVPDLLVAWFDAAPSEIALRFLARRSADPRVQNKLAAIAAGDADPQLRQLAASFTAAGATLAAGRSDRQLISAAPAGAPRDRSRRCYRDHVDEQYGNMPLISQPLEPASGDDSLERARRSDLTAFGDLLGRA